MKQKERRIDLHLPRHWNSLTTQELETVAGCVMNGVKADGGYSAQKVKVEIFLRLTGLEIVEPCPFGLEPEEQYFIARRRKPGRLPVRIWKSVFSRSDYEPFKLYLWQVHEWMKEGMQWIENPSNRTIFPYTEHRYRGKVFRGPSMLMQNFCWQQYRIVNDYMDYYVEVSNSYVNYARTKNPDRRKLQQLQRDTFEARNLLLASLFNEEVWVVNPVTGRKEKDSPYSAGQEAKNSRCFRRFTDTQMQVVFFWWTGMMDYLGRQYPKVFRKGSTKKQHRVNPFEVYTRIMGNMEKYLTGMNERTINRETYTNVLTHLNDMMAEQERMEKQK